MHLLSYVSQSVIGPEQIGIELDRLTNQAIKNNSTDGITGVLFYENGHFFQVIEGEEPQIRSLYDRLEKDNRHRDLGCLVDRPIEKRHFSDWSLDTFHIDNPEIINRETLALLQALYFQNFGVNAPDLVEFTKRLIDEMDTFRIEKTLLS